jgi:hypothetical protein
MRSTLLALAAAIGVAVLVVVPAATSDSSSQMTVAQIAQFSAQAPQLQAVAAANPAADPPPGHLMVKPFEYDPAHTSLVGAGWSDGTGCPTSASVATYPATKPTGTYTDPACPTRDSSDHENDGLVLAKTGPTTNNAAAFAEVKGVKGQPLTELGYDIRKWGPGTHASALGSHCGAGAPRFDVQTTTDSYFVGCSSPPPTMESPGDGWIRLRWGGSAPLVGYNSAGALVPITGNVVSIYVVFDEGTDTGPDFFGAAVLDNIDVNGILGGTGPDDPES